MTSDALQTTIHTNDRVIWSAAALALALRADTPADLHDAAAGLLSSLGIEVDISDETVRSGLAAQAAGAILQAGALLRNDESWADQPDGALLAQGRFSAVGAQRFREFALPSLSGLSDLLATPGARMLDVGTGVAALAVAYAQQFPALTVVGLDVVPRVLKLAAATIESSDVAERVTLRLQDINSLTETDTYALAWLPAPFVRESALRDGIKRIAAALVPGGWVLMAHTKVGDDATANALSRLQTMVYGGTMLDDK